MSPVRSFLVMICLVGSPTAAVRRSVQEHVSAREDNVALHNSEWGKKYPTADHYDPDWLTSEGQAQTEAAINLVRTELNKTGEPTEPTVAQEEVLSKSYPLFQHQLFRALQGQGCLDACAVCMPKSEELMSGPLPSLRTILITRHKSAKSFLKAVPLAPLDTIAGAGAGAIGGVVVGGVGGSIAGGGAGIGGGVAASEKVGSAAGILLGLIGGVVGAGVGGATGAGLAGTMGLIGGALRGVGLTGAFTDCERVGFEQYSDGEEHNLDLDKEQRFTNTSFGSKYGLKKLRAWNEEHFADHIDSALQEGDKDADLYHTTHCERVRYHDFDIRHASECLSHSQLCGGPSFVLPNVFEGQCRKMSDASWLEEQAIRFGDDSETGMFAQWRKMQDDIKKETGYDAKRAQCIKMLCKYGGFKKAKRLHPDFVNRQNIPEAEKTERKNMFVYLNSCKDDFEDLEELDKEGNLDCASQDDN